jgi:hypothetical protein
MLDFFPNFVKWKFQNWFKYPQDPSLNLILLLTLFFLNFSSLLPYFHPHFLSHMNKFSFFLHFTMKILNFIPSFNFNHYYYYYYFFYFHLLLNFKITSCVYLCVFVCDFHLFNSSIFNILLYSLIWRNHVEIIM